MSFIEYTTTPWRPCANVSNHMQTASRQRTWYCGVLSVMRPSPDLRAWLPYRKLCSAPGLIQTLYGAYCASVSSAVMCRLQACQNISWQQCINAGMRTHRNLPDLVNLPKHVPRLMRLSRATLPACTKIVEVSHEVPKVAAHKHGRTHSLHDVLGHVVHTVVVEPKAVATIWALQESLQTERWASAHTHTHSHTE
jgi:hypothetical protein